MQLKGCPLCCSLKGVPCASESRIQPSLSSEFVHMDPQFDTHTEVRLIVPVFLVSGIEQMAAH